MNKKQFIEYFNYQDNNLISNIYDKILLHEKINNPIYFNEFYSPTIWKKLLNLSSKIRCKIGTYGIFQESDRRAISILSNYDDDEMYNYPVKLLNIINMSAFSKLKHSDFLGALMSLGIKREKLGDLIVDEDECYVPVCSDIAEFIQNNLTRIGKSPCKVKILDHYDENQIPEHKFQVKTIIVSSCRLDSIVAALGGISRSNSEDMIKKGLVLLDYEKVIRKDIHVEINSIITLRGYGKFKINECTGKTLKGREKIIIKKYI
ncbi:RNA-binding protein [Clostridium botulinum]|uniref:RNA-binding S4 domain-containing protein n=2 Tax=Clostridium botulinum TaxID=1491 RepID=A0A9Q1UXW3_CLOBO|nr:YlmH/Sll1252 family protein [Clostridium botulinum]AEB75854.1 YlmH protein, putative [Clostridium botulinum BKT015925]KEI04720.1 hypothetical protein Y848_00730 [Clostridium botulinum C/D str. Sp77]KLU75685.1 hypothetical protein CBC3_07965 [Clostridium botulinum V891]KOA75242.1 hypothetical protein ADU78_08630 [Clostridium botulinum]KOA79022.1 hypothetical protein ADU77_05050 [Clostridium botulinum]